MIAPLAVATAVQAIALVVLAAVTAGLLVAPAPKLRAAFASALLLLAPLVLALSVLGDDDASLPHLSVVVIAGLIAVAVAVVAGGAVAFRRWPFTIVPALLAAMPLRVPLEVGDETVRLLVPLYGVLAAAVVARCWGWWRNGEHAGHGPRLLDIALAVTLGLYAVQAGYSSDLDVALRNFTFFYAPFALLYLLISRAHWDRETLRRSFGVLIGLAAIFVIVGFYEFARGEHLIAPPGVRAEEFDPYFRVQSLFFDPNIFGRFLSVVMLLLATVLLFTRKPRRVVYAALTLALLWSGLITTLSQSSMAALLAGLAVLAAVRWRPKPVIAIVGAAATVGALIVIAFPGALNVDSGNALDKLTSGRTDLVDNGVAMFADRPLAGYGSGGFSDEFLRREPETDRSTSTSHTTPVTVAAEQGLIGLLAYGFLVWAAFARLFYRLRSDRRLAGVARIGCAVAFSALVVHSMAYAAFLEDPLTWALLGAGVALGRVRPTPADQVAT